MFPEFHRPQIQCSIFAVEQIDILIVLLHGQWEYGLRVFQHRVTVLALLEFPDAVDEPLSDILFCNLQCKQIQLICQIFRKLCHLKVLHIRLPDNSIIDKPDAAFTVVPCDRLEKIGEHVAQTNLIPAVARIRVRSHFFQRQRELADVRWPLRLFIIRVKICKLLIHNVLRVDRNVNGSAGIDCVADRDGTVG